MTPVTVEHLPPSARHADDLHLIVRIEHAADLPRAEFLATLDVALAEARRAAVAEYDEAQLRRGTMTPGLVS